MLPFPIITPSTLPSSPFSVVRNGESHLLLLKKDGTLYGSGSNSNSQLNQSTGSGTGSYNTFVVVDTNVTNVWAGDNSTFWTSSGNLYFCGLNTNSTSTLYSTGLKTNITLPAGILSTDIKTIKVQYDSGICLITKDGRAFCHGTNTSTTFNPYINTGTGSLPSFTYTNSASIPSTWVEVILPSSVPIKDYMLNTSFGSSSAITRHSGTFVGTDNNMYRYLNSGWNNFTFTTEYFPNVSFYKTDTTEYIGFNYSAGSIRRGNTPFPGATVVKDDLYYILNSYGNLTSTAFSAIQANPTNLSILQCLRPSNGSVSTISLSGNITQITGRTNMYSILSTSNVYMLTKAGVLSTIDYSTIA